MFIILGQGGQVGGSGGQVGGGGGQFYPNNNNNQRYPDRNNGGIPWNDPSNRHSVTLTVEFTVVDSDEVDDRESRDPWIRAYYAAESSDEACGGNGATSCEYQWWWVQFTTADSGSGLRKIDMDKSRPTGGNGRPDFDQNAKEEVYYR